MASRWIRMVPLPGETWRDVVGAEDYIVSDHGRVARKAGAFRTPFDRVVEGGIKDTGYAQVMLTINGKVHGRTVHRLVAEAFIRPMVAGDVVNHLDGVKTNNHVSNLEITDRAGNAKHAAENGLIRSGIRHGMAKLTDSDVRSIRALFADGVQGQAIADKFGITRSYAYHIKNGLERAAA